MKGSSPLFIPSTVSGETILREKKKTILRQQDPNFLKVCISERSLVFLNPETVVTTVKIFFFFLPLFFKGNVVLARD